MRITVIGLGAMGLPMARRLRGAGHELVLCDLDDGRRRAAEELGPTTEKISDAVRDAEVVMTILPADRHALAVAEEIGANGRAGQALYEFSTIGPNTIDQIEARLAPSGIETVGIGLSRGTAAAQAGSLALFVGRQDLSDPKLRAVLDPIATDLVPLKSGAAAKAAKIANNMMLGCHDIAYCEAIVTAQVGGAEPRELIDRLQSTGPKSWALTNQIERHVLADDLGEGYFRTDYMAKDIALFISMCTQADVAATMARIAAAAYRGTIALGHAADYHPVVIRWLELGAASRSARGLHAASGDVLDVLAKGLSAVSAAINLEALRVLARFGLEPKEAARLFVATSSANELMPVVADQLFATNSAGRQWRTDLDGELALADRLQVPSLMAEGAAAVLDWYREQSSAS